ncbi:uncharacterized protein AAGF69_015195 isoform 3-T4 [Amazona ochrocephala]
MMGGGGWDGAFPDLWCFPFQRNVIGESANSQRSWVNAMPRSRNAIGKPPNSPLKSGASLLCWGNSLQNSVSNFPA